MSKNKNSLLSTALVPIKSVKTLPLQLRLGRNKETERDQRDANNYYNEHRESSVRFVDRKGGTKKVYDIDNINKAKNREKTGAAFGMLQIERDRLIRQGTVIKNKLESVMIAITDLEIPKDMTIGFIEQITFQEFLELTYQ